ncbi:MAG: hypothetical protein IPK26_14935 [Planctomycetes bacterium]|nr:hypothetical protein [Planctomycetota bacterium]
MDRPLSIVAFALLCAVGAAQAPAAPAAPAGPAAIPLDPDLPDQLKQLKAMIADPKMEEDFRAVTLIQKLGIEPEKRNPKDVEKLAKGLGDVFKTGKVRPAGSAHIYSEASKALGKLGEVAGKELAKAVTDNRLKDKDYVPLRAQMMVDLGRTRDEKQIDWLLDMARTSPHNDIMAAGGEALGFFENADLKKKREVVDRLIKRYGELHGKATQPDPTDPGAPVDFTPQNARETLNKVEGKWTATLSTLTGQNFTSFMEWQRWLNKTPNWTPRGATKKKTP